MSKMKLCLPRALKVMSRHGFYGVEQNLPLLTNEHHSIRQLCNFFPIFCRIPRHQIDDQFQTTKQPTLLDNRPTVCHPWLRLKTGQDKEDVEDIEERVSSNEGLDAKLINRSYPDYDEDDVAKSKPKQLMIVVGSTRLDAVITKAFGISRSKTEEKLATKNCLVNGKLPQKKATQIKVGDCIDIVLDQMTRITKLKGLVF
ncbi:uncharacterized protein LOC133185893 [Saccostrea echinata]|uniref:uncharacterized protein LOC133185893 n=1 Tax=Saccostrea echinata TaxID=191078 RepID=UPI002A7EA64A|nr:uncharacterized protein LOC133185893 [Saccostrea echinata]